MTTIEIDFEVFKALTSLRPTESVTYNDVLRGLLKLPPAVVEASAVTQAGDASGWTTKGVRFPVGTEFRARHKGRTFTARVDESGLCLNGKRFESPSSAAMSITDTPVNGWTFWECRLPEANSWKVIKSLRK